MKMISKAASEKIVEHAEALDSALPVLDVELEDQRSRFVPLDGYRSGVPDEMAHVSKRAMRKTVPETLSILPCAFLSKAINVFCVHEPILSAIQHPKRLDGVIADSKAVKYVTVRSCEEHKQAWGHESLRAAHHWLCRSPTVVSDRDLSNPLERYLC